MAEKPEMDDIERAAKAMRHAFGKHMGDVIVPWEQSAPDKREAWIVCAKAAKKALVA